MTNHDDDREQIARLLNQPPLYTCIDCDSGDLTTEAARWHAHNEDHAVVLIDDNEDGDEL